MIAIVRVTLVLFALLLVAAPAHASDAKVLVIGLDGTRIDVVERLMEEGRAPTLKRLEDEGYTVPSLLPYAPPEALTLSEVGWSSIAAGVWPAKHGVDGYQLNRDPGQATKNGFSDFLTLIEAADPKRRTFLTSDWANIGLRENGGPIFGEAADDTFATASADSVEAYDAGDEQVTVDTVRLISQKDPDAGFAYYGVIDEVAHLVGSATPAYEAAIERTDARVGRLLAAIRGRSSSRRERWLVLVTTDHGQQAFAFPSLVSHGGGTAIERTSFMTVAGFGAPDAPTGQPAIVDVAPTVLTYLGLPVPANLDGTPLLQAPKVPRPTLRTRGRLVIVRAPNGSPPLKRVRVGKRTVKRVGRRIAVRAKGKRVVAVDVDGRRTRLR